MNSSGFTIVGLIDSAIFTPILVKKSLNSSAISAGSVSSVPFLSIFSILGQDLFKFAASFSSCQARFGFFTLSSRLSA